MYVCVCNKVTEGQILAAYDRGATTMEALQRQLKVATCCGRCWTSAQETLNDAQHRRQNHSTLAVA